MRSSNTKAPVWEIKYTCFQGQLSGAVGFLKSGLGDTIVVSFWPGTKQLSGPEFMLCMSWNLKVSVGRKVFKNKVETWLVNPLSDSDSSKGLLHRRYNIQNTAGKSKDAAFPLVPLF